MKKMFALLTLLNLALWAEPTGIHNSPMHHVICSVEGDGSALSLEDDSVWSIDKLHQVEVSKWKPDTVVVISQVSSHLSEHKYYITNTMTNVYIEADLSSPPLEENDSRLELIYVDTRNGIVHAEDGYRNKFVWNIERKDVHRIDHWKPTQTIIIGLNDSWPGNWFTKCDQIIINIDDEQIVRAISR